MEQKLIKHLLYPNLNSKKITATNVYLQHAAQPSLQEI